MTGYKDGASSATMTYGKRTDVGVVHSGRNSSERAYEESCVCACVPGEQGSRGKKGKRAGGGGGTQTHYESRGLIAVKHVKLGVDLSVLVADCPGPCALG